MSPGWMQVLQVLVLAAKSAVVNVFQATGRALIRQLCAAAPFHLLTPGLEDLVPSVGKRAAPFAARYGTCSCKQAVHDVACLETDSYTYPRCIAYIVEHYCTYVHTDLNRAWVCVCIQASGFASDIRIRCGYPRLEPIRAFACNPRNACFDCLMKMCSE